MKRQATAAIATATATLEAPAAAEFSDLFTEVLAETGRKFEAARKAIAPAASAPAAKPAPVVKTAPKTRKPRKSRKPAAPATRRRRSATVRPELDYQFTMTTFDINTSAVASIPAIAAPLPIESMPTMSTPVVVPAAVAPVVKTRKPRKSRTRKPSVVVPAAAAAEIWPVETAALTAPQTVDQCNRLKKLRRRMIVLGLSIKGTKSRGLNQSQAAVLIEKLRSTIIAAAPAKTKTCSECGLPIGRRRAGECSQYTA